MQIIIQIRETIYLIYSGLKNTYISYNRYNIQHYRIQNRIEIEIIDKSLNGELILEENLVSDL